MYLAKDNVVISLADFDVSTVLDEYIEKMLILGWLRTEEISPSTKHAIRELTDSPGWGEWVEDNSQLTNAVSEVEKNIEKLCDDCDSKHFEYPVGSGVFYKVTNAIKESIDYLVADGVLDNQIIPLNGGQWNHVYQDIYPPRTKGATIVTLGDLRAIYNYGYNKAAHNYGVAEQHKYNIQQLTSLEAVESYDYSQGWR